MPMITVNGTELYCEDSGPAATREHPVQPRPAVEYAAVRAADQGAARPLTGGIAYDHRGQRRSADSPLRSIWCAVNGVIERRGVADDLRRTAAPALILVGEADVATPQSRLVRIPAAGHSAPGAALRKNALLSWPRGPGSRRAGQPFDRDSQTR